MKQAIADVQGFHEVTDTSVHAVPHIPSDATQKLRFDLIAEECVKELMSALASRDMVGIFDGAIDTIYVIVGLCHEYGIPLAEGWEEVHRTNMAKAVPMHDGSFKVIKNEDGKVLKPPGWQKPDLESILRKHGWQG